MPGAEIETYLQDGEWHSRIVGKLRPFASGGTMDEQIDIGRARAMTERRVHLVRDEDGQVVEHVDYRHHDLGPQHALGWEDDGGEAEP